MKRGDARFGCLCDKCNPTNHLKLDLISHIWPPVSTLLVHHLLNLVPMIPVADQPLGSNLSNPAELGSRVKPGLGSGRWLGQPWHSSRAEPSRINFLKKII